MVKRERGGLAALLALLAAVTLLAGPGPAGIRGGDPSGLAPAVDAGARATAVLSTPWRSAPYLAGRDTADQGTSAPWASDVSVARPDTDPLVRFPAPASRAAGPVTAPIHSWWGRAPPHLFM
jgi:hypothetical protein